MRRTSSIAASTVSRTIGSIPSDLSAPTAVLSRSEGLFVSISFVRSADDGTERARTLIGGSFDVYSAHAMTGGRREGEGSVLSHVGTGWVSLMMPCARVLIREGIPAVLVVSKSIHSRSTVSSSTSSDSDIFIQSSRSLSTREESRQRNQSYRNNQSEHDERSSDRSSVAEESSLPCTFGGGGRIESTVGASCVSCRGCGYDGGDD